MDLPFRQKLSRVCTIMENAGIPLVKSDFQYTRYVSTDELVDVQSVNSFKIMDEKNNLGFRLRHRKELISHRSKVVDTSFVLSLVGIICNVFHYELVLGDVIIYDGAASTVLRIITTITTCFLVISIFMYNLIGIRLQLVTTGLDNWKLVINSNIIVKTLLEIIICSIHPIPYGNFTTPMLVLNPDTFIYETHQVPINAILSVLMFLRIYILGRFLVVHSGLFRDTTVQSLGTLSKVNINAKFVFKALMSTMPGTILTGILVTTLIVNSWGVRICEYYSFENSVVKSPAGSYLSAVWLIAVTFLTLGYGDIVPYSVCGKVFAITTGMMGVGIMALCVAVLAKKLEQTRSEKYVHTFVQQIHMDKIRRNAAADVVKQSMLIWRLRKLGYKHTSTDVIRHRRKLISAIREMNKSSDEKYRLRDNVVGTVEIAKGVTEVCDMVEIIKDNQETVNKRLENLETSSANIQKQLYEIRNLLRTNLR
ncbi:small conductance calcium-activated potassium channel protein 2-like isoform X2 [Mytilus trossulus]|uniref:small conductance calcium-activated potassium channel protein 2-like isoform X1 n=2 Tax=Mytilus trossulus TaxID=6551 RepID=UPI003007E01E